MTACITSEVLNKKYGGDSYHFENEDQVKKIRVVL